MAVLGIAMSVASADPVLLGPAQMDAVTAGANTYADAQANAIGQKTFTETSTNVFILDGLANYGLSNLMGYGAGGQAAVLAVASGPSAHAEAFARAGILNEQPDLTGLGAGGEAIALAAATGPSHFAAASAGAFSVNGQTYLAGLAAGSAAPGLAIATAPIALRTTNETVWSPTALSPDASGAAVSVTSTEESGRELVTYTLSAGGQNSDAPSVDSATLSFSKPPLTRIPPIILVVISGVIPVRMNDLPVKPVVR